MSNTTTTEKTADKGKKPAKTAEKKEAAPDKTKSAPSKTAAPDKGKAATADADASIPDIVMHKQIGPDEMREVEIAEIIVDPNFNIDPNRTSDDSKIRPLAESMRQLGLQQPIVLRAIQLKGKTVYHLNEGFRRLKAAQLLGWTKISSVIKTFDDLGALLANSAENTCREAPHPMFLARRMQFIKDKHQLSDDQIAHAFGLSRKHVQNLLRAHKNLAPKLHKDVFSSPSSTMNEDSPSLQWCIEMAKLSHEEQIAAYEARFGKLKKDSEKEDEEGGGEKKKNPRMRNRQALMECRNRHLRKLSETMVEAGYAVELNVKGLEGKQLALTERDRLVLKAVMDWVSDASKPYFLNYIEPGQEEEEVED